MACLNTIDVTMHSKKTNLYLFLMNKPNLQKKNTNTETAICMDQKPIFILPYETPVNVTLNIKTNSSGGDGSSGGGGGRGGGPQ